MKKCFEINMLISKQMSQSSISFSSSGFIFHYHLGVMDYLQKNDYKFDRYYGSGSGAWIAAALLANISSEVLHNLMIERLCINPTKSKQQTFKKMMRNIFKNYFPVDFYVQAKDKLFISLTSIPSFQNKLVSDFKSNHDVQEALIASCTIPLFNYSLNETSCITHSYNNRRYIGGMFSNDTPVYDKDTLVIKSYKNMPILTYTDHSPFLEKNKTYVKTLFPIKEEEARFLFKNGFADIECKQPSEGNCPPSLVSLLTNIGFHTFWMSCLYKYTSPVFSKIIITSILGLIGNSTLSKIKSCRYHSQWTTCYQCKPTSCLNFYTAFMISDFVNMTTELLRHKDPNVKKITMTAMHHIITTLYAWYSCAQKHPIWFAKGLCSEIHITTYLLYNVFKYQPLKWLSLLIVFAYRIPTFLQMIFRSIVKNDVNLIHRIFLLLTGSTMGLLDLKSWGPKLIPTLKSILDMAKSTSFKIPDLSIDVIAGLSVFVL
jgi:hypothetical protein